MSNDRVFRTAFLISFGAHCLILGAPGMGDSLFHEKKDKLEEVKEVKPEEILVTFQRERPSLLPRIEVIGEEKKTKDNNEETEISQQETPVKTAPEAVSKEDKANPPLDPESIGMETPQIVEMRTDSLLVREDQSFPSVKSADENMLRYQDVIKQRIEATRRYPVWAKKQGIEGVVHMSFIVFRNGTIHGVQMTAPSGSRILDEEAVATVNRAAPFPPCPKNLHSISVRIDVAVVFSLEK